MQGQLTVIDLNGCDGQLVKDRDRLGKFVVDLCEIIGMKPFGEPLIKRFGKGRLRGYSAVQLIETSTMVIHLDEFEKKVFIDIFSCKKFDSAKAEEFSKKYFKAESSKSKTLMRK